jgi:uncharacterized coiled-coil DUF342 family protein
MEEMQRSTQKWFSKALNEKFTELSMEMNKVSAEVSDLSKQIVITQESVDEVRKRSRQQHLRHQRRRNPSPPRREIPVSLVWRG